jgi:M6 family metalloprotease-like protein
VIRGNAGRIIRIGVIAALAAVTSGKAGEKLLVGTRVYSPVSGSGKVVHPCLTPRLGETGDSRFVRKHRWSLPEAALATGTTDTIRCLVLRFNFQYESTDDPNTTGRGVMDLSRPLDNPTSAAHYLDSVGHLIDPPPHDSLYFNAHLRALDAYWNWVSEGKIKLAWDIFPPARDSIYPLTHPMSYYAPCTESRDSVIAGLERFFVDCIHAADSAPIRDPGHPIIDFSRYNSIFLFHAGADRQNDIGFPTTCSDLFTGFIRFFGDSVAVNGGTRYVKEGLMMPEAVSQDNRVTALNAVMAHEFGHQLGLPDMYSTTNFLSQLGDFSLMDNNGFGTGLDFGFPAGKAFGAIPVYPDAWCRAYLGFSPVVDFRKGEDVRVVAAEAVSSGIKIARVPISETEYYLIENRCDVISKKDTALLQDSATSVILYPVDRQRQPTGEYDFLMPGSGVLIYHVDEAVAALDYDGNGRDNFQDNHLQVWDPTLERKFISLVEADGVVDFGGYYRSGYGSASDMFRDDRNQNFTPYTNPRTTDNSGNITHIFVTNIRRDTVTIAPAPTPTRIDTAVRFDVTMEWMADSFPVRCGRPIIGLSPIAADLNGDSIMEIIVAAEGKLSVFEPDGSSFLRKIDNCGCPEVYDTAKSDVFGWTDHHTGSAHPVPIYSIRPNYISAGPVVGDFGAESRRKFVAVGYPLDPTSGQVIFLDTLDANNDGLADSAGLAMTTEGIPVAVSFGSVLYALTDRGYVYVTDAPGASYVGRHPFVNDVYHGICRIGNRIILVAGDSLGNHTTWYHMTSSLGGIDSIVVPGRYNYGPIAVDLDRDSVPEIVGFSESGKGIILSVSGAGSFSVKATVSTGYRMTVNPSAGDVDMDGYPEIIIGGQNAIYAFNDRFVLKTGFPITVDDRFPQFDVIGTPICGNVQASPAEAGPTPDIIFPTEAGNVYAFGGEKAWGYPLNSGEQSSPLSGSPSLLFETAGEGRLGYLGGDGWFYLWRTAYHPTTVFWPMGGHDASQSFAFNQASLGPVAQYAEKLPKDKFYSYPNPVTTGQTTIRYFLGAPATKVTCEIYDFSGSRIATLNGSTVGGSDNELMWACGEITPGVYRCIITADFSGDTQKAFTDIAIIR